MKPQDTARPFVPALTPPSHLELSENSQQVLRKRYLRRGLDGQPAETIEGMFRRVARAVAEPDAAHGYDSKSTEDSFYALLTDLRFFPNSPTFTGAGTPLGQLAACFTAGMRVTAENGVKPIIDLRPGDRVLTHLGRYRPVTEVFQRAYQGELLRIKVDLIGTTLEVTPEHPILTPGGWVKAGELKVGDAVAIGLPVGERPAATFDLAQLVYADELEVQAETESIRVRKPSTYQNSGRQANWQRRFVELTPDLARLCGYYISEGSIGPDERYIRFTFGTAEEAYAADVIDLMERLFGVPVNRSTSNFGNWQNLNFYSRAMTAWFAQNFGRHSYGKSIPVWLQYATPEVQEAFLVGAMRGDGLYYEKLQVVKGRTTPKLFRSLRLTLSNPGLIQQIWQMCLRLGYDAAVRPVDTTYVTENARDTAQVSLPPLQSRHLVEAAFGKTLPEPDPRYIRNTVHREKGQVFFRIASIEADDFTGTVYNCEVDEDHSYVTEGVVVHNCFVLPISDDMGRESAGIFQTLRDAALIQQTGGGNGFSFSSLRPKGDSVASSAGVATGPVGFLRVYDTAFGEVAQGGTRRGANMAVLRVDHPDIEEFITCKAQEGQITNFNISVGITDAFMQAVEADADFDLVNPRDGKTWRTLRARDLFEKIVTYAHRNGEPGALFLDAANRTNPVPHLYELAATNPCFAGDTRVATDRGFLSLAELYALNRPVAIATDERARPEWARKAAFRTVSPVMLTRRNTPVLTLHTAHGYHVTATPDHRFLTADHGYVALQELKPGERLLIQSEEGPWSQEYELPNVNHVREKLAVMGRGGDHASGRTVTRQDFSELYAAVPTLWSYELGVALGWLVGDGWLSPTSGSPLGLAFGMEEGGYCGLETLQPILQQWFGSGHVHERGNVRQLTYGRLPYEFFASLGVSIAPATEKRIPTSLWQAPRDAVRGFIAGLFSADGSVQVNEAKQDCTVRLASSSRGLIEDVQLLLANFGIASRIYRRRDRMTRPMPDGKGGTKAYTSAPQFELVIGKSNRVRFAQVIGFAHPLKQARLLEHAAGAIRGAYRERFEDRVVSIEDAGTADVYDLTEPLTSSFIANGFVVHNCGEQWLGPYENCCLGSINLAQHVTSGGQVDWEKLRESTVVSTRFLDNVVDANKYVPAVPALREAALRARRIGLGIMGLGDLMYELGVRYGSEEGQEFAAQVMEFVRYHCMLTSIELAQERGPFLAIKDSIYDPENLRWQPPEPVTPYQHDWGRPAVDWNCVVDGIKQHGIRNAAQTTVAPTGTIGTVAGCEGYGCEPVFALAYTRTVKDGTRDLKLTYTSPLFEAALERAGLDKATREQISEQVSAVGSCQEVADVPEALRHVFVVSQDITAEEHVRMQAAIQAFVDNSISKTINFPSTATVEDVAQAYMLGWHLGCKGLTVYVTGSRQEVVLETKATAESKGAGEPEKSGDAAPAAPPAPAETAAKYPLMKRRPRPTTLHGMTYRKETPLGTAFVTVNINGGNRPFEVFMNVGKAGSDVAAVSEALGRLISLILRLPSPLDENQRLQEVIDQLAGIGGGRSLGFGANRVRSLPDAVAQVLREHLNSHFPSDTEASADDAEPYVEQLALPIADRPIGDLCPDCGQATFIPTEGCRKCYACGYSEC